MTLPHIRIQQVLSVEERELMSGTWFPYDEQSMADIIIETGGVIRRAWHGLFNWGYENIRVRYVHGYAQPPLAIRRAALTVLHFLLVPSNLTERALQQSAEFGVIQLSIPDPTRHRPYGLPFVDTTLALHCERVPLGIG